MRVDEHHRGRNNINSHDGKGIASFKNSDLTDSSNQSMEAHGFVVGDDR